MSADDVRRESEHATPEPAAGGRLAPLTPDARPTGGISRWQMVGGMLLLTFAAYLPALKGEFVISDDYVVSSNAHLTAPDGLRRIWFSTESEQYQPLVYTSYWLERRIWGLTPAGYHLVNIVLHAANALLLWFLLGRIGVRGAAVAAVLFAIHPVNVESVAWIYERKNVLSGLFYFLTFAALFRFEEHRRWHWYAVALLLFAAALLSKASTVVLPAVLLLYWWWSRTGWRWRNVAASIPFFVLAGLMAGLTIWYEHQQTGATGTEYAAGFAERFARAGWIVAFYLGKFFVPYHLMFFYPRWSVDPSAVLSYLPHAVLAVILILLIVKRRTWGRPVLFGLGTYLIALFPVLGFFDIFYQRFSFVADHFQYLAVAGLIPLCVHGVFCGLDRLGRAGTDPVTGKARLGARELAVLVVAICWFLTWQQAKVYANTQTLCEHTLKCDDDSWVAHQKLAEYLYLRGRAKGDPEQLQDALHHFEQALVGLREEQKLRPRQTLIREEGIVLQGLGLTLNSLGRPEEAEDYLRQAVAAVPDVPRIRIALASVLEQLHRPDEALAEYEEAERRSPDDRLARISCGQALVRNGQIEEGLQLLQKEVELHPNEAYDHVALGSALCYAGRWDEGIQHLEKAVQLNPADRRLPAFLEAAQRQRLSGIPAAPGAEPRQPPLER